VTEHPRRSPGSRAPERVHEEAGGTGRISRNPLGQEAPLTPSRRLEFKTPPTLRSALPSQLPALPGSSHACATPPPSLLDQHDPNRPARLVLHVLRQFRFRRLPELLRVASQGKLRLGASITTTWPIPAAVAPPPITSRSRTTTRRPRASEFVSARPHLRCPHPRHCVVGHHPMPNSHANGSRGSSSRSASAFTTRILLCSVTPFHLPP